MNNSIKSYLLHCSNLDDGEYASLWECYHEYSILDWCIEKLNYIMFVLYVWKINIRDYLRKKFKKESFEDIEADYWIDYYKSNPE